MAEAIGALGAIAACDQLIKRFTSIYENLRKAYKVIRHAKKAIQDVKRRTRIIRKLWHFFRETMKKIVEIDEFSVDLKAYKKLDRDLNRQAECVICKIQSILDMLDPLLQRKPVSVWKELHIKFKWFVRDQEDLRLLYVDMELLTGYMRVFIDLVQLQISVQQYKLNKSVATKVQIDTMENLIKTDLREIHRTQRDQQSILRHQQMVINHQLERETLYEVHRILRQELSQVPRANSGNDSSSNSPPPSSPPDVSPSTPPTSSPSSPVDPNKGHSTVQVDTTEPGPQAEPKSSRDNPSSTYLPPFWVQTEPSYVSIHEPVSSKKPNIALASPSLMAEEGIQGRGDSEGIYMATALFGPPKKRHRPPPARMSTDSLTHYHQSRDSSSVNEPRHRDRQHSPRNNSPGPSGMRQTRQQRQAAASNIRQQASKHKDSN